MWRVVLSVVALVFDALFLAICVSLAIQHPLTGGHLSSGAGDPRATRLGGAILAVLMLINALAILFGARLKLPGKRRDEVASVFE